jgi:hypothetical protein
MKNGIVYLIQPQELVGTDRYKVGCSGKSDLKRIHSYKTGSRYICIMECVDPYNIEKKLIEKFNKHFKLIAGREYFEGDIEKMKKYFICIVNNTDVIRNDFLFDKSDRDNEHSSKNILLINGNTNITPYNNVTDITTRDNATDITIHDNATDITTHDNATDIVIDTNIIINTNIISNIRNNKELYFCEICDYSTQVKTNYNYHMESVKHKNKSKLMNRFKCDECSFNTNDSSNYKKHLHTKKHIYNIYYSKLTTNSN